MNEMYIQPYLNYIRFKTREVQVGNVAIGGDNPIRIQTMTNTNTLDIKSTVQQILKVVEAGSELVRIAVPGLKEAEVLSFIKKQVRAAGISAPLVADVHYSPVVAEMAARIFDKVRINPGNYADISKSSKKIEFSDREFDLEKESIRDRILPLLKICKENGTALRIGINHGSLSWRIVGKYGNTPEGMVASALEFVEICEAESFHNMVLSMKASNPLTMIHANRMLVQKMSEKNMNYPIHLGVTEAGLGEDGRVKSAIGIGTLLTEGVGDTIRVSLTEAPEKEIPVAKAILEEAQRIISSGKNSEKTAWPYNPFAFSRRQTQKIEQIGGGQSPILIYTENPSDSIKFPDIKKITDPILTQIISISADKNLYEIRQKLLELENNNVNIPVVLKTRFEIIFEKTFLYKISIVTGGLLADGRLDGLWISDILPENNEKAMSLAYSVLQASRARITKTEYISCPSCGRTKFDIETAVKNVMEATKQFTGLKIAVMGCVVNGPGEMADADFGYVGAGDGKVNIYKGQKLVKVGVSEDLAVNILVDLIEKDSMPSLNKNRTIV